MSRLSSVRSLVASKCQASQPSLFGYAVSLFRYIHRRKYYERVALTVEGIAYLTMVSFVTIGSVLRNVNLLILMTGILLAPLFINWRLAVHRARSLRGRRQLPSRINANQMVNVQWYCENLQGAVPAMNVIVKDTVRRAPAEAQTLGSDSHRAGNRLPGTRQRLLGELRERLFGRTNDGKTAESQVRFPRLMAGQTDIQTYQAFFPQRGKYWFGTADIYCSFPFGLILSRQRIGQESSVMVGPELGVLKPTWEKRLNSIAKGTDSVRRSRAIEDDDFFALRRWRSGDSRKNIHWRSTAKQRFPIVKQFVERNNRDFALVLDLFIDDSRPQTAQDCETVLSFAATTLLSVKTMVEGQAGIAVCGKTLEVYRSKTVGGVVAETTPALAVATGHHAPPVVNGIVSCLEAVSNGTPIYVISSRDMPANLLDGLQTETSNDQQDRNGTEHAHETTHDRLHHANYVKRRFRLGLPMVRWLNVQSQEFKEIFSFDKTPRRTATAAQTQLNQQGTATQQSNTRKAMPSDLADVSQKWIDHARR